MSTRRRQYLLTGVAALGGLALFAYAVRSVGLAPISEGIRRVGWGLVPILALGGVRFGLRTQAWRLCMRPAARLPFRPALAAFLAGDAIGSVTPLGLAASEPTKAFLSRHHLATSDAVVVARDRQPGVRGLGARRWWASASSCCSPASRCRSNGRNGAWRPSSLLVAAGAVAGVRLLRGTWSPEQGPRPAWRAAPRGHPAVGADVLGRQPGPPVAGLRLRDGVSRAGGARSVLHARVDSAGRGADAVAVGHLRGVQPRADARVQVRARSASVWTKR